MKLIDAMDESAKSLYGDLLIRRACWEPKASSLEVADDSFWDLDKDGKPHLYSMSPSEIRADDWFCVKVTNE